jgi:hypothetical protein
MTLRSTFLRKMSPTRLSLWHLRDKNLREHWQRSTSYRRTMRTTTTMATTSTTTTTTMRTTTMTTMRTTMMMMMRRMRSTLP